MLTRTSGASSTTSPQEGTPEVGEEGEEMDATNADDEAMMAMMGMSGFGTTKVPYILRGVYMY